MNIPLKPFPSILQLWIQACLFLGAISRSRILRALLFFPVLGMTMYMMLFTTTGRESRDITTWTTLTMVLFQAADILVINDVAELRLVGQKTPTNDLSFSKRCKWAIKLLTSPRGIGWTHEPRHVLPPHPPATQSRWDFIKKQTLSALIYFIMLDILHTWALLSPVFRRDGISLASGSYPMRIVNMALLFAQLWFFTSFNYTLGSIVAVALNISEPSEWPAIYGRWADSYTLRRFWGRTWHQVFRRIVSTQGDFVTFKILRLRKGTFLANTVNRYVAFFVSGILHACGEYGMFREEFKNNLGFIRFFLMHATLVTIEVEVAKVIKLKPTPFLRYLGYVWTGLWFVHTMPPWMDPQFRRGMADNYGFPVSITHRLLRGEWTLTA